MAEFGFIGAGNMGGALAAAVCRRTAPSSVFLSAGHAERAAATAARLGCRAADNAWIAANCDYIFLGV